MNELLTSFTANFEGDGSSTVVIGCIQSQKVLAADGGCIGHKNIGESIGWVGYNKTNAILVSALF